MTNLRKSSPPTPRLSRRFVFPLYLLAVFALAAAAHVHFFHLTEWAGLSGFSVVEYLAHAMHPENFARDYPGGSITTGFSLITKLYVPLEKLTHASGLTLMTAMIWAEIAAMMLGAWVLWRVLTGQAEPPAKGKRDEELKLWAFGWLAALLVVTGATSMSVSDFRAPYFHGQFYGYADALGMAAVAFAFRRNWSVTAFCLALGFTIHPIMTLFAAGFVFAAVLADARNSLCVRSVLWGAAAAVFMAAWSWTVLGFGASHGPGIPAADYIALTRFQQVHWYPFDTGLVTEHHDGGLSPFLALMLLMLLALRQADVAALVKRRFLAGFVLLAALTCAGVYISAFSNSPQLIKLCLLRASDFMTLLAPFVILLAVWTHWRRGDWLWTALYVILLLEGGYRGETILPPSVALVYGFYFAQRFRRRERATPFDLFLAATALAVFGLYLGLSFTFPNRAVFVKTLKSVAVPFAVLGLVAAVRRYAPARLKSALCDRRVLIGLVSLAILGVSGCWAARKARDMMTTRNAIARDYLAVQYWAHDHTKPDALFMVDPCINYGWRDFSERSSLGTPREWYMTGWLYNSDLNTYETGQKIGATLGLDISQFLSKRGEKIKADPRILCSAAQDLVYAPNGPGLGKLVRTFGVDYFVLQRDKVGALQATAQAVPVFENATYSVFTAEALTHER